MLEFQNYSRRTGEIDMSPTTVTKAWGSLQKQENDVESGNGHTSDVTDPRTTKDANELARGASIVTDGDHIAQCTGIVVNNLVKHIDQTIGSTAAGEDHDLASWSRSHVCGFENDSRVMHRRYRSMELYTTRFSGQRD